MWSGLALAMGFAAVVDLMLLASFVWVELLSPLHMRLGWLAIGALWGIAAAISVWSESRAAIPRGVTSAEVLFREALSEYLQGSWFEAETILGRLLHLHPRDVEARLLLATLLRHTRRYDEALDHLDRLERLRDAQHWAREIASERERIDYGRRNPPAADSQPAVAGPTESASRQAA